MIETFVNIVFIVLGLISLICVMVSIYVLIKMILGKMQ